MVHPFRVSTSRGQRRRQDEVTIVAITDRLTDWLGRPALDSTSRAENLRAEAVEDVAHVASPRWRRRYAALVALLDALAALAGGTIAAAVEVQSAPEGWGEYVALTIAVALAWVAAVGIAGGYEQRFLGIGSEEYHRVVLGALGLATGIATIAWTAELAVARSYVIVALLFAGIATLTGRYLWRKRVHQLRRRGRFLHRTLVLGPTASATELVGHFQASSHHGYHVVGVWLTDGPSGFEAVRGAPILGHGEEGAHEVVRAVESHQADTVAITAGASLAADSVRRLSWSLEPTGANLVMAPALADVAGPRTSVRPVEGLPLLHIEQPTFTGAKKTVKAGYDVLLATLLITTLLPVLAAIAVAIKVDSPGPVFFRQKRVGMAGHEFTILKFRTMVVDAEQQKAALAAKNQGSGPLFKIRDDPRVTRVGAVLRRTSLDELPQLFNVIAGDMSLVGPRPHLPEELELFGPDLSRRLLVKPGLTGLWQVSGRSDLTFDESMRVDLRYVENWSLALDISILWKTVWTVLRGSGAY